MKTIIVGVDALMTYKNKRTNQIDPSVIIHMITKSDNGFKSLSRPAFLSMSSDTWAKLLSSAGSIEKMYGYYASVDFNDSGYVIDIDLVEPSGLTIPWKK